MDDTIAASRPNRARLFATATEPALSWERTVKDGPDSAPDRWTIATMPVRLKEKGDVFAGALLYDQVLPALA